MLSLPPSVRVFVATHPVDGRKGADSLLAMIRSVFEHDPLTGHLYVFFSRRRDRVRVVYWDRNGIAMWSKRLEQGRFGGTLGPAGEGHLDAIEPGELAMVLDGIELIDTRRRPRWEPRRVA